MLQFQQHLFCAFFFSQMTSCFVHYDIIYHPFPINSQYLKTWGVDSPDNVLTNDYILPGSSCSLSCDIFSSCTAITCSPDTFTPTTSKEKSHSFLQPVQCRKTGSVSVGNWNTRCGWGNRMLQMKVTSACTSFKFSHKDFLKAIILFWVTAFSLLCSIKETIDLPHAVEKKKENMKRKKKERKNKIKQGIPYF